MKTIQVSAKEWLDKVNGNSYFTANIYKDDKFVASLPFQYGYGDYYIDMASAYLDENNIIDNPRHENGTRNTLWRYCEENSIKLITNKQDKCLKREVLNFIK